MLDTLTAVLLLAPPLAWEAPLEHGHGVHHKVPALRRVGILPPHRLSRSGAPTGVRRHGVGSRVGAFDWRVQGRRAGGQIRALEGPERRGTPRSKAS